MTPSEADSVIAAIKARRPAQWPEAMWTDFRTAMIRIRITGEQGIAAAVSVILTAKFPPTPAHYLEAFMAAQGEVAAQRRVEVEQPKNLAYHPRVGAVINGFMWAWKPANWDAVVDSMPIFERAHGWRPDWEAIVDPLAAAETFDHRQCEQIGLWLADLRGPRPAAITRRSAWDDDVAARKAAQAQRVARIAELRKRAQGARNG